MSFNFFLPNDFLCVSKGSGCITCTQRELFCCCWLIGQQTSSCGSFSSLIVDLQFFFSGSACVAGRRGRGRGGVILLKHPAALSWSERCMCSTSVKVVDRTKIRCSWRRRMDSYGQSRGSQMHRVSENICHHCSQTIGSTCPLAKRGTDRCLNVHLAPKKGEQPWCCGRPSSAQAWVSERWLVPWFCFPWCQPADDSPADEISFLWDKWEQTTVISTELSY